ncbi:MAG: hypothetical protein Q9201_005210 [Fulgogasparrea decipioides]
MPKRKTEEAQPEHNGIRENKKLRTHESNSTGNTAASLAQGNEKETPFESSARKDYKEAKAARKQAKKVARQQRRDEDARAGRTTGGDVSAPVHASEALDWKKAKKRRRKEEAKSRGIEQSVHKSDKTPSWIVSEPVGGQMLDLDPLFSPKEDYLLIAFGNLILVYSTATSLLVRKLHVGRSDRISTFVFSSADPNHLYVGTKEGVIQIWDWLEGRKLHFWFTKCRIFAIAASSQVDADESSELVYTIDRKGAGGPWRISAHRLRSGSEADQSEVVTLRKSQEPITAFKVVEHGKCIIATSGSVLTLGTSDVPAQAPLGNVSYTWRDIECPEWISCFDVRIVHGEESPTKKQSGKDLRIGRIDIVIGGLKGSLHVYDNLLRNLIRRERKSDKEMLGDLTSRQKHWHRNAVLTVKWSRDGNYIISGGLETVLLIWQLETGSHSTLPHLGAALEGLVVSPSGSSYAIRLADNSAMILSTAELKPTFSVAGIQLRADDHDRLQLPHVGNVDAPNQKKIQRREQNYLAIGAPSGLLCAVPSTTSSRIPSTLPQSVSYLQTYDVLSAQQLSRQALTRSKATDLNVGPESNTIEEPNVVLMRIKSGGDWLATVDEWMPPKRDLASFIHSDEQAITERQSRREIHLKFWSWDHERKLFELVSRIDDPHASQSGVADEDNRVFDLVANPSSLTFATVGGDGLVRVWTAHARFRDGSTVKNKQGGPLTDWRCNATISIDIRALAPQLYTGAKLAYSKDGSCIAVACTLASSPWTIHIIDPYLGAARSGPYGPFTGPLYGLGIIDRYLILLSDQLRVWNLVTQRLAYGFTLAPHQPRHSGEQDDLKHLTVDAERGTFAVAFPDVDESVPDPHGVTLYSKVIIFEPTSPAPVFVATVPRTVTVLTKSYRPPGYVVVNSAAEIRTFTPRQTRPQSSMALPTPPETPSRGLQNIYGVPNSAKGTIDEETQKPRSDFLVNLSTLSVEPRIDEYDAVVVRPEELAAALDAGPGNAMPPVSELFERVARLFAGNREP